MNQLVDKKQVLLSNWFIVVAVGLFLTYIGSSATPAPPAKQPEPGSFVRPQGYLSLAFAPDGKSIATTCNDQLPIEFWEASTGKLVNTIKSPRDTTYHSIEALAFSPNGETLATSGTIDEADGEIVQLWDVKTGKQTMIFKGHPVGVSVTAFSPDGKLLASGAERTRLWDIKTGKSSVTLQGQEKEFGVEWITTLAFTPNGKALASWNSDGTIRVWDVQTGKSTAMLKGRSGRGSSLAFDVGGKTLIAASTDKSVQQWDLATGKVTTTTTLKSEEPLTKMALSPDLKLVVAGDEKGGVYLWHVTSGKQIAVLSKHKTCVSVLAFSPDGKTIVSGGGEPALRFDKVPEQPNN